MQTRIKLKKSIQQSAEIQKEINILKGKLSILMGDEPKSDYKIEEVNKKIDYMPDFQKLNELAKKHRPVIKELKYKINNIAELKNLSKSEFLPKVYVRGGYQYNNNFVDTTPEDGFMVETGVSFKLDWNKPYENIRASKEAIYQVENLKRNTQLTISMQLKSAYENYKTAISNHKVALSALDEAKEYFRITKLKYANGIASNTDVLDAESMLTDAKANEKKSYYKILNAYFSIESAIGTKLNGEENE
jgi:outer membrane protein TolC